MALPNYNRISDSEPPKFTGQHIRISSNSDNIEILMIKLLPHMLSQFIPISASPMTSMISNLRIGTLSSHPVHFRTISVPKFENERLSKYPFQRLFHSVKGLPIWNARLIQYYSLTCNSQRYPYHEIQFQIPIPLFHRFRL